MPAVGNKSLHAPKVLWFVWHISGWFIGPFTSCLAAKRFVSRTVSRRSAKGVKIRRYIYDS